MDDSKTEFIQFGSRQNLTKCIINDININGVKVYNVNCIKHLGVNSDYTLSMKELVKHKCNVAMANIFKIKSIRNVISEQSCTSLMLGLVISHLDYAYAFYIGVWRSHIGYL